MIRVRNARSASAEAALLGAIVGIMLAFACASPAYATPTFTSPDADQFFTVGVGDECTLSVEAAAEEGDLSYEWKWCVAGAPFLIDIFAGQGKAGIVEGAQDASVTVAASEAGTLFYWCFATDSTGTATSPMFRVDAVEYSGTWSSDDGEGTWEYDPAADELKVDGQGAIPAFGTGASKPWSSIETVVGDGTSLVIADGITGVGDNAFTGLKAGSARIGKDVQAIGGGAFYDLGLSSVEVPSDSALSLIGDSAFDGNENLAAVAVPSGCSFTESGFDESGTTPLRSFPATCNVTRRCTVTFADADGAELAAADASYVCWGPDAVEAGSAAYDGDVPAKGADGAGHYSFAGWVTRDADGAETAVEANEDGTFTVSGDATFYASFACGEHSYVDTVVEATTEAGGYTEHACSECGYAYRDAETPKLDEATAAFVDAIKALPESVEGDEAIAAVKAAAEAYLALTDEERAAVADKYAAALVAAQEKAVAAVEASASAAADEAAKQLAALEQAKAQAEADAAAAQASALKASSLKVTAKAVKAKAKKKTTVKASKAFSVAGAAGKVTFAKVKGNAKITVSAKGKVTVRKGLKKGKTYKVKVLVADAGTSQVAGGSQVVTLKVKVK